jgi:uncharacterized protein (DUF1330 family)
MNKEQIINLLKDDFEECTEKDTPTIDGYGGTFLNRGFIWANINGDNIYFKPKQKFPIVFEGDNHIFKIYENFRFEDISRVCFFTDKDIEANQNALNKLKELRQ